MIDPMQEELEIEFNSQFDDHHERWAGEAEDMRCMAEWDAEWERREWLIECLDSIETRGGPAYQFRPEFDDFIPF